MYIARYVEQVEIERYNRSNRELDRAWLYIQEAPENILDHSYDLVINNNNNVVALQQKGTLVIPHGDTEPTFLTRVKAEIPATGCCTKWDYITGVPIPGRQMPIPAQANTSSSPKQASLSSSSSTMPATAGGASPSLKNNTGIRVVPDMGTVLMGLTAAGMTTYFLHK